MNLRAPLAVGSVVLASAAGFIWFLQTSSSDQFGDRASTLYYADFADASGLRTKTRVQISGIDVGKVDSIEHTRAATGKLLARVGLRIRNTYQVFDDAAVHKAAESFLGDFRLDLDPGTPGHRAMGDGEVIGRVDSLSDIDEIKSQLLKVSKNVAAITDTLARVISGKEGEGSLTEIIHSLQHAMKAIERTTETLETTISGNDELLDRIVKDVGQVTHTLATIARPGGDLLTTSEHVTSISAKLERVADGLQELMGTHPSGSAGGTDGAGSEPSDVADAGPGDPGRTGLRSSMTHLEHSLKNVDDITRKVDEGQGTLGRMVNDPTIADRVEETLTSINQIIGSIAGIETLIELRSEFDVPFSGTNAQITPSVKNTLALRILPRPDKYYLFEAISDPRGKQVRALTTTSFGGNTYSSDETITSYNSLKFSAEFAKRYWFATLRFGIIENTGGLGLNLHFLDDRGEVRLDAFDFARRDPSNLRAVFPRLRATAMYQLINHIHIQGGFDDPFNTELRTWFMGGILRFTDEDLRGLLAIAPRP